MKNKINIFWGPAGSGKTTEARKIKEYHDKSVVFTSGAITFDVITLRAALQSNSLVIIDDILKPELYEYWGQVIALYLAENPNCHAETILIGQPKPIIKEAYKYLFELDEFSPADWMVERFD